MQEGGPLPPRLSYALRRIAKNFRLDGRMTISGRRGRVNTHRDGRGGGRPGPRRTCRSDAGQPQRRARLGAARGSGACLPDLTLGRDDHHAARGGISVSPPHRPLRKAGYRVAAVDRDRAAPGLGLADAPVAAASQTPGRWSPRRASTAPTRSSRPRRAASLRQRRPPPTRIAGSAPAVAQALTNKGRMRALWKAAGLRQPEFVVAGLARGGARCPATVRAAGGGQAGRGLGQQRGLGRGRGRRHRAFARGRLRRPWRPGNRRALRRRPAADRRGLCRGGRRRRDRQSPLFPPDAGPPYWVSTSPMTTNPPPSPSATKPSAVSSGPAT